MGYDKHVHAASTGWVGQLRLQWAKLCASKTGVDWQYIVQGAICWGPRQIRLCIACNMQLTSSYIVHTYVVGVADTAAREGSLHNVLHLSRYIELYFHAN